MSGFLPDGYKVKEPGGFYFKPQEGKNKVRLVTKPLIGLSYWINEEGVVKDSKSGNFKGFKPVRVKLGDEVPEKAESHTKEFWIVGVFNYAEGVLQTWEITQRGIKKALQDLSLEDDWGNPLDYDISLTKTGEGLDTEYSIVPLPKTELSTNIKEVLDKVEIRLENFFKGKGVFVSKSDAKSQKAMDEMEESRLGKEDAADKADQEVDNLEEDLPF